MRAGGASAAELVRRCSAVLLDFDGPICKLFAEVQSADVAADLRRYLEQRGAPVPDDGIGDPLAVLRMSAGLDAAVRTEMDAELVRAEVRAVSTAIPTPDADAVIRGLVKHGRRVAVVSNNSPQAVREYLRIHRLGGYVSAISARPSGNPLLMKPNPYLLKQALSELKVPAAQAVFVGDSVTDIEAANAADVAAIGYANKPGKAERLTAAGAVVVVDAMTTVL